MDIFLVPKFLKPNHWKNCVVSHSFFQAKTEDFFFFLLLYYWENGLTKSKRRLF